jgi:hypothetical protein
MGLPVTRVISRVILQQKLAEKAEELEGSGVLLNNCQVEDYEEVTLWNAHAAKCSLFDQFTVSCSSCTFSKRLPPSLNGT